MNTRAAVFTGLLLLVATGTSRSQFNPTVLVGEEPGEVLGQAVALEGDRLAVTAAEDQDVNYVIVYGRVTNGWAEEARLFDPTGTDDEFGFALDLSGNRLAVGAGESGRVDVYLRSMVSGAPSWRLEYSVTGYGYGEAVELNGNDLFVGVPTARIGRSSLAGRVDHFSAGLLQGKLQASPGRSGGQFGTSMDYRDGTLVVSEPGAGGWVHVFLSNRGRWVADPPIPSPQPGINFARSVAVSELVGRTDQLLAVGAPKAGGVWPFFNQGNGRVLLYRRVTQTFPRPPIWINVDAVDPGKEPAQLFGWQVEMSGGRTSPRRLLVYSTGAKSGVALFEDNGASFDPRPFALPPLGTQFNSAMALDGDCFALATPFQSLTHHRSGMLSIYDLNLPDATEASSVYLQTEPMVADLPSEAAEFGYSACAVGGHVFVGAPNDPRTGGGAGAVYVFRQLEELGVEVHWLLQNVLTAGDAAVADGLGFSVEAALDTTSGPPGSSRIQLAVGAPEKDAGATNAGGVYVFEQSGTSFREVAAIGSPNPVTDGRFGHSVSIDALDLLVGQPGLATRSGEAWTFLQDRTLMPPIFAAMGRLLPDDPSNPNDFGSSVSVSAVYVVGDSLDSEAEVNAGALYTYYHDPQYTPYALEKILGPVGVQGGRFGQTVLVDGDQMFVGVPQATNQGLLGAGIVAHYTWNGFGRFDLRSLFGAPAANVIAGGEFGSSLAYEEGATVAQLVVGAPASNGGTSLAGCAQINLATGFVGFQVLLIGAGGAPPVSGTARVGQSVAVLNGHCLIGAPGEVFNGVTPGAVYGLFQF